MNRRGLYVLQGELGKADHWTQMLIKYGCQVKSTDAHLQNLKKKPVKMKKTMKRK